MTVEGRTEWIRQGDSTHGPEEGTIVKCPGCGMEEHAGPCHAPKEHEAVLHDVRIGSALCDGRYLIERLLGKPPEGHYRVYDQLKKERPTLWELELPPGTDAVPPQFETLAASLMQIDHERIRSVTDFFVEGSRIYLVVGFVQGQSVLEFLAETGPRGLAEDKAIEFGQQALDILGYLHRSTPPHVCGSQVPDCLVITPSMRLYLRDFGVSELRSCLGLPGTRAEALACYSPIEVMKGRPEPRSDLYTVGAVMHLLLTGKPVTGFGFPPIRGVRHDVSAGMEDFLDKAVRLIPDNRYSSARDMASSLEKVVPSRRQVSRGNAEARAQRSHAAYAPTDATDTAVLVSGLSKLALELATAIRLAAYGEHSGGHDPVLPPFTPLQSASASQASAPAPARIAAEPAPPASPPARSRRGGANVSPSPASDRPTEAGTPQSPHARVGPSCDFTINARDGSELVAIPEGDYSIGSDFNDLETPVHRVHLRSFRIGRAPVSNEQFEEFVSQAGYEPLGHWKQWFAPELRQFPAVAVTWEDAVAYCRWAGLRLPSEVEWEAAATGVDAWPYPWGHDWQDDLCNWRGLPEAAMVTRRTLQAHGTGVLPAGCFPLGASPLGVLDLLGNVWEWCSTLFRPYPYDALDGREDGDLGEGRILRGGSCRSGRSDLRGSARKYFDPLMLTNVIGFRVASD